MRSFEEMQALYSIFGAQEKFMERVYEREVKNGAPDVTPNERGKLSRRNVQARLHEIYGYIVRELSEAMDHLKNKPWREHLTPVNREAFIEEVVDVLHFYVEFCIVAGISPTDLVDGYFNKTAVNHQRQDNGY